MRRLRVGGGCCEGTTAKGTSRSPTWPCVRRCCYVPSQVPSTRTSTLSTPTQGQHCVKWYLACFLGRRRGPLAPGWRRLRCGEVRGRTPIAAGYAAGESPQAISCSNPSH